MTMTEGNLLVTNSDEAPERLLGGQLHQQEGGDRGLCLTVAHGRIVHRVRFQHVEQLLLARLVVVDEHLVVRELAMLILAYFVDDLRIAGLVEQVLVPVGKLGHQMVCAGQQKPCLLSQRVRDAFSAALTDLWKKGVEKGQSIRGAGFPDCCTHTHTNTRKSIVRHGQLALLLATLSKRNTF